MLMAFEHLLAFSTPAGVALTDVFARCLKEVLNEYAYYADCAGLSYDVRVTKGGFELMFYGYHHKLPVLVQRVVDEMRRMASGDTPCPPELYARMKARQTQLLRSTSFRGPTPPNTCRL
jgi:insulysin